MKSSFLWLLRAVIVIGVGVVVDLQCLFCFIVLWAAAALSLYPSRRSRAPHARRPARPAAAAPAAAGARAGHCLLALFLALMDLRFWTCALLCAYGLALFAFFTLRLLPLAVLRLCFRYPSIFPRTRGPLFSHRRLKAG